MSFLTYAKMREIGLLDENFEVHPSLDKIMPVAKVNKFFFGVLETPHGTKSVNYFIDAKIIIKYKDSLYLVLSKLKEYLDSFDITNLEQYPTRYLLINYCNTFNRPLIGIQDKLNIYHQNFIKYISRKKLFHHNIIKEIMGTTYFKGRITQYNDLLNIITVIFDGNKPLVISFGSSHIDAELYVDLSNVSLDDYELSSYSKLYQNINQFILMGDPDQYIINNISIITGGNISFARLLVESHKDKENHCIPIDHLFAMTRFKLPQSKKIYIDRFCVLYRENTIWAMKKIETNNIMCVNFEGMNKYFLNLDIEYLYDFNVKESISNMYYNITNELIESYRLLYNYKL
jgi:hypothetical protein